MMCKFFKYQALVAVILILTDLVICIKAYICAVGKERDHRKQWKWVLSHPDPCQCTEIILGGMNTMIPMRRFTPIYVEHPLLSDDTELIRGHYGLECPVNKEDSLSSDPLVIINAGSNTANDSNTNCTQPAKSTSNGIWNAWNAWSCNAKCDWGTMTRQRTCGSNSTSTCVGEIEEISERPCMLRDWCRKDRRCGPSYQVADGQPGKCRGECCSKYGWCGSSKAHCMDHLFSDNRCCTGIICPVCQ